MSAYTIPISAFIYANQGKKKNWNCPSSPFNDYNYSNTRDWAAGRHCSVMIATPYNNILTKNRTKIDGHSGSFWCYTQIIVTKPKAAVRSELQFFTFTKEKYRGKNLGDFFYFFLGKEQQSLCVCSAVNNTDCAAVVHIFTEEAQSMIIKSMII